MARLVVPVRRLCRRRRVGQLDEPAPRGRGSGGGGGGCGGGGAAAAQQPAARAHVRGRYRQLAAGVGVRRVPVVAVQDQVRVARDDEPPGRRPAGAGVGRHVDDGLAQQTHDGALQARAGSLRLGGWSGAASGSERSQRRVEWGPPGRRAAARRALRAASRPRPTHPQGVRPAGRPAARLAGSRRLLEGRTHLELLARVAVGDAGRGQVAAVEAGHVVEVPGGGRRARGGFAGSR
jgi:hypothetical protein